LLTSKEVLQWWSDCLSHLDETLSNNYLRDIDSVLSVIDITLLLDRQFVDPKAIEEFEYNLESLLTKLEDNIDDRDYFRILSKCYALNQYYVFNCSQIR
jgi:hypothetical protein